MPAAVEKIVYDATRDWHGSISAEHGIGTLKKSWLAHTRSPEEIALMRTLKTALDPDNILNPGKIF
jgi:FAD/FMN-containing dehydrogenase